MKTVSLPNENNTNDSLFLLRLTCFVVFAGRAWQHLFWDAPLRTLLWDQELMQGVVESLTSMTWEEYVTSRKTDFIIQSLIRAMGLLYVSCALLCIFISRKMKYIGYLLIAGHVSLLFLSFLDYKEKFFQMGEFMEHAVQFIAPLILYIRLFSVQQQKLILIAKIAVAITFIGHGLYCIGYYPQPGNYVDMIINILHMEEDAIHEMLKIIGVIDFAVAIIIFIPKISNYAMAYCVFWGALTAMARVISGVDLDLMFSTLNQWMFETLFRLSHALLPLWILLNSKNKPELIEV